MHVRRATILFYAGVLTLIVLIVGMLALSGVMRVSSEASPSVSKPPLGTAASFAVLGATTVTNTGPTVLGGDLGVFPGSAITGFPPGLVIGATHKTDAVAQHAQSDVGVAYNSAKGAPCGHDMTGQDLGGKSLVAGVYCFSSSAQLTGHLTLSGSGVFIFQIGSKLTTGSNASVSGVAPCNVFWQVGSSATVGTDSRFVGNILALMSIAAQTGATFDGSLYARNGAVTLDTNTVNRSQCEQSTPTPTPTHTPSGVPTGTPANTPTPENGLG
jgi:ice-binding like protein